MANVRYEPRDHVYPILAERSFQFLGKIEYFWISIKGQNCFAAVSQAMYSFVQEKINANLMFTVCRFLYSFWRF